MIKFAIAALTLIALSCSAQQTVRIRLLDGKSGKSLPPASIRVQATPAETPRTLIPAADPASVLIYFQSASSFTVSDSFKRCDVAAQDAPPALFSVHDILDHGVVSANTCGKPSFKPVAPKPGELDLYVRHATPCELSAQHVSGINFCTSPAPAPAH